MRSFLGVNSGSFACFQVLVFCQEILASLSTCRIASRDRRMCLCSAR